MFEKDLTDSKKVTFFQLLHQQGKLLNCVELLEFITLILGEVSEQLR